MSKKVPTYWTELSQAVGCSWNRFWFTPSHPLLICLLRIAVGLLALSYHLSFSKDLTRLFAEGGFLSRDTLEALRGDLGGYDWVHFSLLDFANSPTQLWIIHVVAGVILLFFTLGLLTRVTSILSLLVVLSYVHSQSVLSGPFEPLICMLLLYLSLAPCGAYLSIDCWRVSRRQGVDEQSWQSAPCWTSTVSLRLIQLHCAGFYLLMGLSKLAGDVWWEGQAVWTLLAQTRSRPVDLTFLREQVFLLDAWTHAIVLFELLFPLLIWKQLGRPILLGLAVLMWTSLAVVTGLVGFSLVMLVASAAFLPAEFCQRLVSCFPRIRREASVA